jgi:hypothetical protein
MLRFEKHRNNAWFSKTELSEPWSSRKCSYATRRVIDHISTRIRDGTLE